LSFHPLTSSIFAKPTYIINVITIIGKTKIRLYKSKKSIVLITDESQEESRYGNCFEALLRLSASCCQVPSQSQQAPTQAAAVSGPIGEGIRTPGGQELKAWTAEELASEAQKRLATQPDLPTWSEEDLTKLAEERGSGLPDGMEVWKEDELLELAEKRRRGGLNIPEWQPDQDMSECSNCGYSLRSGWTKCPVCEAQVGEKHSKEEKEEPKDPSEEEQDEISEVEVDSEEDANQ